MTVRTTGAAALLVVIAGGVAGCDRDDVDAGSRQVDVLVLAIRDVVSGEGVSDPDDALPVVYVVGSGEHTVAATVQSDVAAELHDEIDVRFADDRDEAIETDQPDQPVTDSGVLLVVEEIPEDGGPIDVPIEIYWSERDDSTVVFTFAEGTSSWVVTATSLVSPDA